MAKRKRKYSKSVGKDVELEMRRYERGTACFLTIDPKQIALAAQSTDVSAGQVATVL